MFLVDSILNDRLSSFLTRVQKEPAKALVRYNELVAVGQQVPQRKKEDWYDRLAWWSDVKILGGLLSR